jgi:hypothetical protein
VKVFVSLFRLAFRRKSRRIFARPEPGKESQNLKAGAARYAARAELFKGQSAKMLAPLPA